MLVTAFSVCVFVQLHARGGNLVSSVCLCITYLEKKITQFSFRYVFTRQLSPDPFVNLVESITTCILRSHDDMCVGKPSFLVLN